MHDPVTPAAGQGHGGEADGGRGIATHRFNDDRFPAAEFPGQLT
jgi:hypothetical protein